MLKKFIPKFLLMREIPDDGGNSVYLTFDDGPNPAVTPEILKLLQRYGARATFFIPGCRIERAPSLLERILEYGHEIGNHTFSHCNGKQPGFWAYLKDIHHCQMEIERTCGAKPHLFRPPCGIISPTTLIAPKVYNLQTVTWSLDSQDWKCRQSEDADLSVKRLLQSVKSGDVILFHDDNDYVVSILKIILPVLNERGFVLNNLIPSPSMLS